MLACFFAKAQNVDIPDWNFKNALLNHYPKIDTNNDGEIQVSEAEAFTGTINCVSRGITDLTGIEAFTNINRLNCSSNQLTSLNMGQNKALTNLHCGDNKLTNLDISQNTALLELNCYYNKLTNLDLSKNTALTYLNCKGNPLVSLDLSKNPALIEVDCYDSQLTALNVSKNSALLKLYCHNNQLSTLDISQNTALTSLNAAENQLTSLDLSTSTALEELYLYNNQLSTLDVSQNLDLNDLNCNNNALTILDVSKNLNLGSLVCTNNGLTALDVSKNINLSYLQCSNNQLALLNLKNGKNRKIYSFNATNNPNLSCIQVDNISYATAQSDWFKSINTSFCVEPSFGPIVNIPDANFKAYLLTEADIDGDGEIQVMEAEAFTEGMWCYNKNIASATGIEAFTKITQLDFSNNQLATLDISKNISLVNIYAVGNQLTALDVSKNPALQYIYLAENQLTALDVSQNIILQELDISDNQFSTLDLSQNTNLEELYVQDNQLTSLNIKNGNNNNIWGLDARNNLSLSCIKVDNILYANAQNNWLKDATANYCTDPSLGTVVYIPDANFKTYLLSKADIDGDSEIQTSEAEAFTDAIRCSNKNIANLTGIEAFKKITKLICSGNQLTVLDVSKNTALTYLDAGENQLTALDVSKNTTLINLDCSANQLTALDVSKNIALRSLYVSNNQGLSRNATSGGLGLSGNRLTVLDVSKNLILNELNVSGNQLTSLNLKNGNNADLYYIDATDNPNLTCIQVDNVANADAQEYWHKASTASYNTDCGYILPVTLVSFTAKANGNYAKLQWQTASEQNNKGFMVYRGGDDVKFVKIGELPAVESPNLTAQTYTFTDKSPLNGTNYYKLIQIDNDGKTTELGIGTVSFSLAALGFQIYPNPTTERLVVYFEKGVYSTISISNISGQISQTQQLSAQANSLSVSLSNYPAGIYFVTLAGKGTYQVKKVVKL